MTTETKPRFYQNAYTVEPDEDDVDDTANPNTDPTAVANPEPDPVSLEDKAYKSRYDSLKAHYDKMIVAARTREKELLDQVKQSSEKLDLPGSLEELEQWRKDFPDLYKIVRMISRLEATETAKELEVKVNDLEVERKAVTRDRAETVLVRMHPDFPELRNDKSFREWLDLQDPTIQGWLYNGDDPHLAAKAVTMYKAERVLANQSKPNRRTSNVDASLSVTRSKGNADDLVAQPKQWRMSEINRLHPKQYELHEKEIDAAIASGNVINDM